MKNLDWYRSLKLPEYLPPDWLFAPVWIILYLMIFSAFWIVLRAKSPVKKSLAFIFFAMQLFLNFIWSTIFFTMQDIQCALIIVIVMGLFILLTIFEFHKISKLSAYLLVPYFLWTSYALYLNLRIYILNS